RGIRPLLRALQAPACHLFHGKETNARETLDINDQVFQHLGARRRTRAKPHTGMNDKIEKPTFTVERIEFLLPMRQHLGRRRETNSVERKVIQATGVIGKIDKVAQQLAIDEREEWQVGIFLARVVDVA